jgi:hypothetical protein
MRQQLLKKRIRTRREKLCFNAILADHYLNLALLESDPHVI